MFMLRKTLLMAVALLGAGLILMAAPLAAKHFLWHISSPSGKEAYIMGSIHLAYAGLYPLAAPLEDAFAESSSLVVEINTSTLSPEVTNKFIASHGMEPKGKMLMERLSPETATLLKSSGFYSPSLGRLKPWLAALQIQLEIMEHNGFYTKYGLDEHFMNKAKERGIKILELETLEEQMYPLASLTPTESDLFLRGTLQDMSQLPKTMKGFMDTWRKGEVESFGRLFFQEANKYPELQPLVKKLIVDRNHRMATRIHSLLEEGQGYFIVVGAGHLVGDESIQSLLIKQGYTFTQK